ncbi:hypothetical protein BBP40_001337 [Aspergillus hancockii]|nr:hypothetical protein BBP40_001337 [Aspergillus hancockii]
MSGTQRWDAVLLDVEWAVSDELLAFASQTLTDSGFPWVPKPTHCSYYLWEWGKSVPAS